MDSKLKELGRSLTLQRAAASGRPIAGMEKDSSDESAPIVPGLEVIRAGVEVRNAFKLDPNIAVSREGETVVTVADLPLSEVIQGITTMSSLSAAGIEVVPDLVVKGLMNKIGQYVPYEVGRYYPETNKSDIRALVPVDPDLIPAEDYMWKMNPEDPQSSFIVYAQNITTRPEDNKTPQEELKELEDPSRLPATLSENPSGEIHGRHILILRAAPQVTQKTPELAENSSNQLPGKTEGSDDPAPELIPGTNFVPKRANNIGFDAGYDSADSNKDQVS